MTPRPTTLGVAVLSHAIVPLVLVLAAMSILSSVLLLEAEPPSLTRLDGRVVQLVVAGALLLCGAILPLLMLTRRKARTDGGVVLAVVGVLALTTHGVARSSLLTFPLQNVSFVVASIAALGLVLLSLAAGAERRDERVATSRLPR